MAWILKKLSFRINRLQILFVSLATIQICVENGLAVVAQDSNADTIINVNGVNYKFELILDGKTPEYINNELSDIASIASSGTTASKGRANYTNYPNEATFSFVRYYRDGKVSNTDLLEQLLPHMTDEQLKLTIERWESKLGKSLDDNKNSRVKKCFDLLNQEEAKRKLSVISVESISKRTPRGTRVKSNTGTYVLLGQVDQLKSELESTKNMIDELNKIQEQARSKTANYGPLADYSKYPEAAVFSFVRYYRDGKISNTDLLKQFLSDMTDDQLKLTNERWTITLPNADNNTKVQECFDPLNQEWVKRQTLATPSSSIQENTSQNNERTFEKLPKKKLRKRLRKKRKQSNSPDLNLG